MKAIVNKGAGDPRQISLTDVPQPTLAAGQVLIQVKAASVNIVDTQGYQNFYPTQTVSWQSKLLDKLYVHGENKILGADGAGIVTAVGANVNSLKVGDEVCFIADDYLHGAWAELIAVSAKNVALKPANLSFTAAAALPTTAGTALAALKKARVHAGEHVLLNGASGGVGLFALQLAQAMGAIVTAVVSPHNFDLARLAGAAEIVDYHQTDITQRPHTKFDVIIGLNGYHSSRDYRKILRYNGRYVAIGGVKQVMEAASLGALSAIGRQKQIGITSLYALKNNWLQELTAFAQAGQLHPYIDQTFAFTDAQKAVEFAATEHLQGKVVLQVAE